MCPIFCRAWVRGLADQHRRCLVDRCVLFWMDLIFSTVFCCSREAHSWRTYHFHLLWLISQKWLEYWGRRQCQCRWFCWLLLFSTGRKWVLLLFPRRWRWYHFPIHWLSVLSRGSRSGQLLHCWWCNCMNCSYRWYSREAWISTVSYQMSCWVSPACPVHTCPRNRSEMLDITIRGRPINSRTAPLRSLLISSLVMFGMIR